MDQGDHLLSPDDRRSKEQALAHIAKRLMTAPPDARMAVLQELDRRMIEDLVKFMVRGQSPDAQRKIVAAVRALQNDYRPADNAQLHQFIVDEFEMFIPRVAVCEGHCAPFDFVADAYFERGILDKLIIGNRGSGKTQLSGLLLGIVAKHKPRIESVSAGAIENQAKKCYDYFKKTVMKWSDFYNKKAVNIRESNFPNGSKVEVVIGTMSGVNSPHPNIAHLDEIELLRPGVYEESANMAQSSSHTINGKKVTYRAQNWLTSSWKKPRGLVTQIMEEVQEATAQGIAASYQIYRWCVFETTQPCEEDCGDCPFKDIIKGKWEDGTPRTFESVCKRNSRVPGEGRLKRSEGFITMEDTLSKFRRLPKRVWEAQQESKRPTAEGLVYDVFDEDIHALALWDPDPTLGPVDVGVDFGGKNPFAATFWQTLNVGVTFEGRYYKEGSVILFDEVYISGCGDMTFGLKINEKLNQWEEQYPGFIENVVAFYCDPAAKSARANLRRLSNHGTPGDPLYRDIITIARGHVLVDQRIAHVYEKINDNEVFFDTERCPNVYNELLSYEYPKGQNSGQPSKENDHSMDAMGYRFWNVFILKGRSGTGGGSSSSGSSGTGPSSSTRTVRGKVAAAINGSTVTTPAAADLARQMANQDPMHLGSPGQPARVTTAADVPSAAGRSSLRRRIRRLGP